MSLSDVISKINFINISSEDLVLFEWKAKATRSYLLDLNYIKENKVDGIFFHFPRTDIKIAYIRYKNLIHTIAADVNVQFQLLEAILEVIIEKFHDIYDTDVILSFGNVSASAFNGFITEIENVLNDIKNQDLGKYIRAQCRACQKSLQVFIKKSIIANADSYPVPIVYNHKGHALLCYIDKNFEVRGVEIVNSTS